MNNYILVEWPEYQEFMENPEWEECLPLADENACMVPEYLYYKWKDLHYCKIVHNVGSNFYDCRIMSKYALAEKEIIDLTERLKTEEKTIIGIMPDGAEVIGAKDHAFISGKGMRYWYKGIIQRGTIVLFEQNGKCWTDVCIAASEGLPYVFSNGTLPGIQDIEIVGTNDLYKRLT